MVDLFVLFINISAIFIALIGICIVLIGIVLLVIISREESNSRKQQLVSGSET